MNKEVINKIDVLVDSIKNSKEYLEYTDILEKVNKNKEIKELVFEIKKINKELVLKPSNTLETLLKEKEDKLNSIPIYLEYKYKLNDLNNLLLVVKNKIDNFVNDLVID